MRSGHRRGLPAGQGEPPPRPAQAGGWGGAGGQRLPAFRAALNHARVHVTASTTRLERLIDDADLTTLDDPGAWLDATRQEWTGDRTRRACAAQLARDIAASPQRDHRHYRGPTPGRDRGGPDLGR